LVKMNATLETATSASVAEIMKEIIYTGRKLSDCGFHAGLAGNISVRLGPERLVCTCAGADKGGLQPEHLMICDLNGALLEGTAKPTSEILMHLNVYKARPDVAAVIHAHPPTATAFAAASEPLDRLSLPEMIVWLGPVALVPYGTPGSPELSAQLQPYLKTHDAFLLENHGALTVGANLRSASQRMELIEQNARITLIVRQLGKEPFVLKKEKLDELANLRNRLKA
jgi:L-fuculose-phosphate aldolase